MFINNGATPLPSYVYIAAKRSLEMVKLFLDTPLSPLSPSSFLPVDSVFFCKTPLQYAAEHHKVEIVKELIKRGADAVSDYPSDTPLEFAARPKFEVPNDINKKQKKILEKKFEREVEETIEVLVENGGLERGNPLSKGLCQRGNYVVIETLVRLGALNSVISIYSFTFIQIFICP